MKRFNEEHPQLIPALRINSLKDDRENRKIFNKVLVHIKQKQLICNYNDNAKYAIITT